MTTRAEEALAIARVDAPVSGFRPSLGEELTPEVIDARVAAFERDHVDLRQRQDAYMDLYELKPYNTNKDKTTTFPSYTSNMPRTFAKKVMSLVSSAALSIRVPYQDADEETRRQHDLKERLFYSFLEQADERLVRRGELRLAVQMAWHAAIRGYICLRAVLVKRSDGSTYADLNPWDSRGAAWGMTYDGLSWAAHTSSRTIESIRADYHVDLDGEPNEIREVTDYYNRQVNAVVVKGHGFVKVPQLHGGTNVPIVIVPVGPTPIITANNRQAGSSGYGESIFAENRGIYNERNEVVSIFLALIQKARDRSYVLYSPGGGKSLEDNPNEAAGVIPLDSTDKLDLVPLPESTKDSIILGGLIGEEIQLGSLPKPVYGEVPFQLSGYAINSLRQAVFGTLDPPITAMQDALSWALWLVEEQYARGAYEPVKIAGYGNRQSYFSGTVSPDDIADLPRAQVTYTASVPQDDVGKIAMAQQARQGAVPLLPDVDILDRIMGVRDVGAIQDAIKEQLAERLSPQAMLYTLMRASENRGRDDLAGIYLVDLLTQRLQQKMTLVQTQMQAASVGMRPEVLPTAEQGIPPPSPTPQAGPNVPPGQPRPGAQGQTG